ncbi:hypothetical protein LBMAG48_22610 [Phycisphaerae bacterium]|jgi:hypothetical protein|nr:hypothetical protein LBMAG48_22610 [Phycisphaerae bacterium]
MGSIPTSPRAAVQAYCTAHIVPFTSNATAIGLTTAQATEFATLTTGYVQAAGDAEAARIAAATATENATAAYNAMRRSLSRAVSDIRDFASDAADPQEVYNLAQIPARQDPSAVPAPGQPRDVSVAIIAASGELELSWKSSNPPGTTGTAYIVRRRLPTETVFSFVGVTGERKFVDSTFIAGPDNVEYTVQAQRGGLSSPLSEIFLIRFGRSGTGRQMVIESATSSGENAAGKQEAA